MVVVSPAASGHRLRCGRLWSWCLRVVAVVGVGGAVLGWQGAAGGAVDEGHRFGVGGSSCGVKFPPVSRRVRIVGQ